MAPESDAGGESLHWHRGPRGLRAEWGPGGLLRTEVCGEKSQGLWNLPSKPLTLWRGKGYFS